MYFVILLMFFSWRREIEFAGGTKFNAETFSELSNLANQGKNHLDSITNKANMSRYGSCWKNAITELQVSCKSLSENVQKDLALRLTDCFLQTSGYEPVKCEFPKTMCLQSLSDRAFNAYTEFYTHTHSICYFLESQIWQEEAEKTVNKLSLTSTKVSQQLVESERIQQNLLKNQKESLFLQYELIESSKGIVSTLKTSQENMKGMLNDFQSSASEQRKLLVDVFENLSSFRAWVINELSWFSSSVFFLGSTIISIIFTSVSRTRSARIYILLILALNFSFERFICSVTLDNIDSEVNLFIATDTLYTWIWLLRKFCILLSGIIIVYSAFSYHDYNFLCYKLLLEIKNQNTQILNYFNKLNHEYILNNVTDKSRGDSTQYITELQNHTTMHKSHIDKMSQYLCASDPFSYSFHKSSMSKTNDNVSPVCYGRHYSRMSIDEIDSEKNSKSIHKKKSKASVNNSYAVSSFSEKLVDSDISGRSGYNLRSHRLSKATIV